jgi:ubiquitin fusion degradation protein 1
MDFLAIQDSSRNATILNRSDKIIMPEAVLDHLHRYSTIPCPYTFQLENNKTKQSAYSGVLEFTSPDAHIVYIPRWLMLNLGVDDGDRLNINSVTLDKGSSIKLRPQSEKFFKISNPKALLERHLRNFTTLYQGEIITIQYLGRIFDIDVLETQPDYAINIIDTDINLEFVNMFDEDEPHIKSPTYAVESHDKSELDDSSDSDEDKGSNYWKKFGSGQKLA